MTEPSGLQGPYPPQYGQYPGYPGYQAYPPPKTNGMAIASMVVSLIALPACWLGLLLGPTGAILGHVASRSIKNDPESTGAGMAKAGIIIGWIVFGIWGGILAFVIMAASGVFGPALQ